MQSNGVSLREISRLEAARMEEKLRESSPPKAVDKYALGEKPLAPFLFMILAFVLIAIGGALVFVASTNLFLNPMSQIW